MMNIVDLQSSIIGRLISSHPSLANELEVMSSSLPEKVKGQLFQKIFSQPVDEGLGSNDGDNQSRISLPILSANEILSTVWPEPVWAVPGLLPAGLTLLAGAPKIGKSWLSLQLAKAIASGGTFLEVPVERGPVLICALEDPPRRLKSRMNVMNWPPNLMVDFITIPRTNEPGWSMENGGGEILAQTILEKGYRLVVIDTLSRAIPDDQQDVQAMTRALTPLQEMAHQVNCAVMLNDHHRKAGGINPDVIADILGSTAKGAMADTVWSLYRERGKNGAKLAVTGRDIEEHTLQLEFDATTCNWRNLGNTSSLNVTDRRQEILDALSRLGRAQLKQLEQETDQPASHLHNRLQELVAAGLVTRDKAGRNVFYKLCGSHVTDVITCNSGEDEE